jgi:hypothetical protein
MYPAPYPFGHSNLITDFKNRRAVSATLALLLLSDSILSGLLSVKSAPEAELQKSDFELEAAILRIAA